MPGGNPDVWRAYVASIARNVAKRYDAQLWRMETLIRAEPRDDEYRLQLELPLGRRIEFVFNAEELAVLHDNDGTALAPFVEARIESALKADGDERIKELARGFDETWRPTDQE
jgi:hypothetical protein